jgi:hypothetical protein
MIALFSFRLLISKQHTQDNTVYSLAITLLIMRVLLARVAGNCSAGGLPVHRRAQQAVELRVSSELGE